MREQLLRKNYSRNFSSIRSGPALTIEAVRAVSDLITSASSEGSGESAHMHRLARVFAACRHKGMDVNEGSY